jgi:hypothetical protein
MESSTSTESLGVIARFGPLMGLSLALAACAAAILIWYLWRKPPLSRTTRLVLLLGLGVLPIGAAMSGNVATFEYTKTRTFCGSCHVMEPYTFDSGDPDSDTLAARHSRVPLFGDQNCYACHADYGMFGAVTTKINGMAHAWHYYTSYRSMSIEEALPLLEIYRPFPNSTCMHCHSTKNPLWAGREEHAAALALVRSGEVSCASEGCHGPAHPFSKEARKALEEVMP